MDYDLSKKPEPSPNVDRAIREGWVRDGVLGYISSIPVSAFERSAYATGRASADSDHDKDWVLAMAAALGTDSGLHVPIVPTPEAFAKLFAAVRGYEIPRALDGRYAEAPNLAAAPEAAGSNKPSDSAVDASAPDEVDAMIARLNDPYQYDVALCQRAAALLLREREKRETFYMDYRMKCDEQTKALHVRAEQAEARAAALAKELRTIVAAYDAYRARGVAPAPNEYQTLVRAIRAARAIAKDTP